jgi:general secretion pathway protein K
VRIRQGGAAILMALIIVAIAATMAATMLSRQQATLVSEEARRHSTQARWILRGAMDWVRLILREDARASGNVDHLGEAWAVPLKAISLKTFLAANERADDAVFEAFLEGKIEDAQAKFNLRNLVADNTQPSTEDAAALEKLLTNLGIGGVKALTIEAVSNVSTLAQAGLFEPRTALDLMPSLASDKRTTLNKFVTLLPRRTTVNANTASAEVLSAVFPKLDLTTAKSIVARRGSGFAGAYYTSPNDFTIQIPPSTSKGVLPIDVKTNFFEVTGIVTWDTLTIEQHALVERVAPIGGGPTSVNVVKVAYGPTMPETLAVKGN